MEREEADGQAGGYCEEKKEQADDGAAVEEWHAVSKSCSLLDNGRTAKTNAGILHCVQDDNPSYFVAGSGLARSQARHRYQLAMEDQGCHFFARRRISSGLGRSMGVTLSVGFSLPKVRAKPLRTP